MDEDERRRRQREARNKRKQGIQENSINRMNIITGVAGGGAAKQEDRDSVLITKQNDPYDVPVTDGKELEEMLEGAFTDIASSSGMKQRHSRSHLKDADQQPSVPSTNQSQSKVPQKEEASVVNKPSVRRARDLRPICGILAAVGITSGVVACANLCGGLVPCDWNFCNNELGFYCITLVALLITGSITFGRCHAILKAKQIAATVEESSFEEDFGSMVDVLSVNPNAKNAISTVFDVLLGGLDKIDQFFRISKELQIMYSACCIAIVLTVCFISVL